MHKMTTTKRKPYSWETFMRNLILALSLLAVLLLSGVSGCAHYLKGTIGVTTQGVHVVVHDELANPVDLEIIDDIYHHTLVEYSAKWDVPMEKLDEYMDPSKHLGVHTWTVELLGSMASCPDHTPLCGGWASKPSFMGVVWETYRYDAAGTLIADENPEDFCPARTALSHELTHLLLMYDQGTLDPEHKLCWKTVATVVTDTTYEHCSWLVVQLGAVDE